MAWAGDFDAYAVTTRSGPHVTLQAGVVHLGRHWTTTSRDSVKARSIRRHGWASATITDGLRWRVVGGPASLLDAAHPATIADNPLNCMLSGGAVLRLGLGSIDQLMGYAQTGRAVPRSFLPTGRVILAARIRDQLVFDGDTMVRAEGQWEDGGPDIAVGPGRPRRWRPDQALHGVPDENALLARRPGRGWLGVQGRGGAVALPGVWEPSAGLFRVSRTALVAVVATLPGAVCVTCHDSISRRPDEKLGVMLRGTGSVVDVDDGAASIALKVQRVTHWCGFRSATMGDAA